MKGNNANPTVLRRALFARELDREVLQAQNALVGKIITYSEPLAEVLEGMTTKARSNS